MKSIDNIRFMLAQGWPLSPGEQQRLLNITELSWALRGRMPEAEFLRRLECLLAACRSFELMYGVADAVPESVELEAPSVPSGPLGDMITTVRKEPKLWP